jgi:hypothetical protein
MHLYIVQIVTMSARYIRCRSTLMSPGASLWVLLVGVCSETSFLQGVNRRLNIVCDGGWY